MGEKSVILEECNAQSLQVKQVTPDLFHFVSSHFSKRKKKSDVVGGLTHCKNHVNLFHVRYQVKKKTINIDRDQ